MGALTSRQNIGVEEVDITVNHAYRYPPKSGNYFSSHFIMGGERFDTAQPEMYLFGENTDLNFLGSRPAPFPYPAPSASEPSRTLKSLVNIRKESLRFVRIVDDSLSLKEPENRAVNTQFNIEFTFDCDVRCAITIMYFCTEEVTSSGLIYTPRDPSMNSETYHYKRGANQQFSQVCHIFDPSQYPEESLLYSFDREVIPIVIYCLAEEGEEPFQSHATIAVVEKHSDGYSLKPLKQKLFVDGLCYLLQEIYGIENKNTESKIAADDDPDDNGAECVICMCDLRDTLILPCRHLCLCNCCADSLRAPFRALLQIKALQKNNGENVPAGYEAVSLIEALNGPSVLPQQPTAPPYQNMYVQLPQSAADGGLDGSLDDSDVREYQDNFKTSKATELEDSTTQTDRPSSLYDGSEIVAKGAATQMRMSVLMAQESEESLEGKTEMSASPPPVSKINKNSFPEDSVLTKCEATKSKELHDGAVKKRTKSSSGSSTVGCQSSPMASARIKETSLCTNDADDVQELTETLSLLDDLSTEPKKVSEAISSVPKSLVSEKDKLGNHEEEQSQGGNYPSSISNFGGGEEAVTIDIDKDHPHPSSKVEDSVPADFNGMSAASKMGHVSRSFDGGIGQSDQLGTPLERAARKGKHKTNRSSGTKNKKNSRGYTASPNVETMNSNTEELMPGTQPESQSLPGTPLSHSSAL
ncbi:RING finger protein [Armadillidium nasatum]|uniref:RING-type E3 ubiquitin transferase n=1 Tax=Armadillidium nasatum TaxID=96803 RepID=A0A5N5TGB9_9CRUS|nr:RING finger protein [Armadillidium nasatum]